MEDAVQDMRGMDSFRRSGTYFGRMLAISIGVHVAFSLLLLSPRHGQIAMRPVAYLDLSMTKPAVEVSRSAETKQAAPPPGKIIPLPETSPRPEPTEFDKLEQGAREALDTAAAKPEAIEQASLALGITNGYFSSLAEGQTLHPDIKDYYFTILRSINEKWWIANGGHAGAQARAMINVVIARDGNIVNAQIVRGSGSMTYDRSLLKALQAASPFPPLPEKYRMAFFEAPLVFNPPLNLMTSGNRS